MRTMRTDYSRKTDRSTATIAFTNREKSEPIFPLSSKPYPESAKRPLSEFFPGFNPVESMTPASGELPATFPRVRTAQSR